MEMEREEQEEQVPGGEMTGSEWHWEWVACKTWGPSRSEVVV